MSICVVCRQDFDIRSEFRWITCTQCEHRMHYRHINEVKTYTNCLYCKADYSLAVIDKNIPGFKQYLSRQIIDMSTSDNSDYFSSKDPDPRSQKGISEEPPLFSLYSPFFLRYLIFMLVMMLMTTLFLIPITIAGKDWKSDTNSSIIAFGYLMILFGSFGFGLGAYSKLHEEDFYQAFISIGIFIAFGIAGILLVMLTVRVVSIVWLIISHPFLTPVYLIIIVGVFIYEILKFDPQSKDEK